MPKSVDDCGLSTNWNEAAGPEGFNDGGKNHVTEAFEPQCVKDYGVKTNTTYRTEAAMPETIVDDGVKMNENHATEAFVPQSGIDGTDGTECEAAVPVGVAALPEGVNVVPWPM